MRFRRLVGVLLVLLMILPAHVLAVDGAETLWTRTEGDGSYVTVRLPYPEGNDMLWSEHRYLAVRYADTKEPVALSSELRSGYLFATVPIRDAKRPLEVFKGEPANFPDCYVSWNTGEKEVGFFDPPLGADDLNIRGIITGDEKGDLHPKKVITRAEAFAIVCRLLSLEPEGDPGFLDVTEQDWFYETASAAKAAGITVEPEFFRPNEPVTRGEITIMLSRAMKRIGWLRDGDGTAADLDFVDAHLIPDWALGAYLDFEPYGVDIATYRETEELDEFGYIQAAYAEYSLWATREEVIGMIYDALRWTPNYPSQAAIEWGFDEEMPVIDGSTSTMPYTNAVYAALFTNYRNHPSIPESHSKSYYAYERLISGEADLLFIAAKPTQDTIDKAAQAGVELEFIPIAYDAMVFFTNGENPVDGLTGEQIKNIYVDNAYDNWTSLGGPDAGLIPYCRNADSGSQALMEEFFLGDKDIHPDIRRETTSLSMASVLTDVWDAHLDDPASYALGYSIYYYYQSASWILLPGPDTLKLMEIDGVYPAEATIADGSYPLAGYNYIAIRADQPEDSAARRMVEFMLSPAGQQCVVNAGFGALE